VAFAIQDGRDQEGFPNWATVVNRGWRGVNAGRVVDLMALSVPAPGWMSEIKPAKEAVSRELVHTLGRYPGHVNQVWEYMMDHRMEGRSDTFSYVCLVAEVLRGSHQGLDQGAQSGWVRIDAITVKDVDGGVTKYHQNLTLFNYINGWEGGPVWRSSRTIKHPKAIQNVHLKATIYHGHEAFHDVGGGWNPGYVVSTDPIRIGPAFGSPSIPSSTVNIRTHDRTAWYGSLPGSHTVGTPTKTRDEYAIIRPFEKWVCVYKYFGTSPAWGAGVTPYHGVSVRGVQNGHHYHEHLYHGGRELMMVELGHSGDRNGRNDFRFWLERKGAIAFKVMKNGNPDDMSIGQDITSGTQYARNLPFYIWLRIQ
jgi:hypothetical protein